MKAPIGWLKDFTEIPVSTKTYMDAMTMSGSKVEGVHDYAENIEKVVVARILSIEKHPDADRLRVCKVDAGAEIVQIVTGAQNVKEGDLIPLALVGAKLPVGDIKASKLRGVESYGMMCSHAELKLSKDYLPDAPDDGVYVIQEDIAPGTDIKEALGLDKVVEFEITSNRPDCLSVFGLARETAATLKTPFRELDIQVKEEGTGNACEMATVIIEDADLCPRYSARIVTDVRIAPSPVWMQRRLAAAGMRPISNIVDITNYVMLELGQPMHAFDFDSVKDGQIIVRRAKAGEHIVTLDDQDRTLEPDMLMIADPERCIGIAGVMGGANTEVSASTTRLLLESANFHGPLIRVTGKKLGLRSEASGRFEKGLDPQNTLTALNRCAQLIEMLGAGKVVPGVIDCDKSDKTPKTIVLDVDRVNRFLGTTLSKDDMLDIFRPIGFGVDAANCILTIPSFRSDIEHPQDLAEEVARFYGYNNIKATLLSGKESMQGGKSHKQRMEDILREAMIGCGFSETYTYSFTSTKVFDSIRLPAEHPLRSVVTISNPLGEDYSIMRTTTLPDMLRVMAFNGNRKVPSARLFELSKVYWPVAGEVLPDEREVLTIGLYGDGADYLELKGALEQLVIALGISVMEFRPEKEEPTFHPGRTATMWVPDGNGVLKKAALLGEVHPEVASNTECPKRALLAQVDVAVLFQTATLVRKYKQLPKFPSVSRDIAVIVADTVLVAEMATVIKEAGGALLEQVSLFDVYQGEQVGSGLKSVAYALEFRAPDKTLTDEEVSTAMANIVSHLQTKLNAQLR